MKQRYETAAEPTKVPNKINEIQIDIGKTATDHIVLMRIATAKLEQID